MINHVEFIVQDWSDDEIGEIGISKSKVDIANVQVPVTKPPIALKVTF